ncbi:MAG: hypothetical protein ACI9OJ_004709 [Myxococcota bacterium]|jgi:hypothetical protein
MLRRLHTEIALSSQLLIVVVLLAPALAVAEPIRDSLDPQSASDCPAREGMCARWLLKATRTGTVMAEVVTDVPVAFGQLKTWPTERLADGRTTRFSWEAKAGDLYELPLRTVIAPHSKVGYSIKLDGLEVAKPPDTVKLVKHWKVVKERVFGRRPKTKFSRSSAGLRDDLAFLKRDAWSKSETRTGAFDGPLTVDIKARADRCYTFVMRMKGRWSAGARRGAKTRIIGPDGQAISGFDSYYKDAARLGTACPQLDGPLRVVVRAYHKATAPWANDVATGRWTVTIWSKPSSPFAYDAAAFAQAKKAHTRGMKRSRVLHKGSFDGLKPIPLVVKARRCYTVIVSLGADGRWTDAARKAHSVSINGDFAGLNVSGGPGVRGPGAVGSLGCFVTGRPGQLTITARRKAALTGTGTIELFEGRMPSADLAERKRELRQERRTIKDVAGDAWGDTCTWCAKLRATCDDANGTTCEKRFKKCVSAAGYKPRGCGQ